MTNLNESVIETREDIPLKSGSKSTSFNTCNEYFFEGSRFVTTAFVFLTTVITVALIVQIYYGDFQVIPHGSVATDSRECSEIGTLILKQGGNAIDASIAAALCLAVVNPHTTGLDAASSILIYNHKSREDATSFSFIDFAGLNQTLPKLIINLAQLHQLHSHLPWKNVVAPSAELAMRGFLVSKQFEQSFKATKPKKLFKQVVAGEKMVLETLADTLRNISEIPEEDLYKLVTYFGEIKKLESVKQKFRNYNIFIPKSQNIGKYIFSNLKYIEELNFTKEDVVNEIDYLYKIANVTQYVYGEGSILTQFHQGTISNIAVMDKDDLYVSLVIGMYSPFGSQEMTNLGYILDIETSMPYSILPLIITDTNYICAKRVVLGVNDVSIGSQIITSWVYGFENVTTVIEYPRFIILENSTIGLEDDRVPVFSRDVVDRLHKLGNLVLIKEPYSSCNVVEKFADNLNSHSDSRGGGISSRF